VHSKEIWAEKTPSNAFTLHHFLDTFPGGYVIHIVRHPLDAIASLTNRGMSEYNAVAVYLLNTAMALELINHPRVITIKYEDLVIDPESTIEQMCSYLGLEYEKTMLLATGRESGVDSMKGWNYKETAPVQQGSMGRFGKLGLAQQKQLLDRIAITKTSLPLEHQSIYEIANRLKYELPDLENSGNMKSILIREKSSDLRTRMFTKAHFTKTNYPLVFE